MEIAIAVGILLLLDLLLLMKNLHVNKRALRQIKELTDENRALMQELYEKLEERKAFVINTKTGMDESVKETKEKVENKIEHINIEETKDISKSKDAEKLINEVLSEVFKVQNC